MKDTYGPMHKFWGPLSSFLYAFMIVFITAPTSMAVIILTSAEYIMQLVVYFICIEDEFYVNLTKRLIAILELTLITYINCTSVKLYVKVQGVFTFLKIAVCLIIIGGGIYQLIIGRYKIFI